MKKLTLQNIRHTKSRSRDALKKIARKDRIYVPIKYENRVLRPQITYVRLIAPQIFNLQYENVNEVLLYINKLKSFAHNYKEAAFIDFTQVIEFGEGAIGMLLTVMDELNETNPTLEIKGNTPNSDEAKNVLEKSGFFKYVSGHTISQRNRSEKNTMNTIGNSEKSQTFLPKVIHKAMETVWGVKARNPLLYDVAFEMIRNSCDHAFKKSKQIKWYLTSTHLEKENLVKFSFTDNGKGILKTLSSGKLQGFMNLFKDNSDILDTAFKNGINSRTGLSWRGKGLPTIYENYQDNYVKNLIVISNDVFIDFDRRINENLTVPFDGTYYFWILNRDCQKIIHQS